MAKILTIAVIGAGVAGRAIAYAAAIGGYKTVLEDILPASLRQAESGIRRSLDQAFGPDQAGKDAAFARVEYASTVEQAARPADLVIECVPEELESKLEIFILLDKICRPHAILACTTSSLNISEIASVTYRPRKCVGLRFSGARLDVVQGAQTDEETVAACIEMGRYMKKEVAVLRETSELR